MLRAGLYISLFAIFFAINIGINYNTYSKNREYYLNEKLDAISFQYEIVLKALKEKSDVYFSESINTPTLLSILEDLNDSNQDEVRERLKEASEPIFNRMRERGIEAFRFYTKDGKPLLNIGKSKISFKKSYQITYSGKNLGSVEIGFSFQSLVEILKKLFDESYLFIVSKSTRKDINSNKNYIESKIGSNFYVEQDYIESLKRDEKQFSTISRINQELSKNIDVQKSIERGNNFITLADNDNYLVHFLSIKQGKNSIVYIITYIKDSYIQKEFQAFILCSLITNLVTLLVMITISYIKKEKFVFINSILNNRNNLIFVQEKDEIIKVNDKLLEFLGFSSLEEFQASKKRVCDFFIKEDGFLYKPEGYGKNFLVEHIKKNPNKQFKVKLIEHSTKLIRIFSVNIVNLKRHKLHLVILSDITPNKFEQRVIEDQASRDKLTGIYNKSRFDFDIQELITKNTIFSLVLINFDNFKEINKEYGYMAGDKILVEIAELIDENIRKSDSIYRWSGDEFVIIVNDNMLSATKLAEKLRRLIENHRFYKEIPIYASLGVTEYRKLESVESLLERVNKALHKAKSSGKNCVVTC